MLAMQAIAMDSLLHNPHPETQNLKPEDIDVTPKSKPMPKGCKVFLIEGIEIIALNEKSARKKYSKTNKP
jgi:hypothetical protein